MSTPGPLPYLKFCDTEVANAARTLEYLRNGLGDTLQGHWELSDSEMCSILYRLNGGTCMAPESFVSPVSDPAPWYDPTEPGSATFLGVVLLDLRGYDSTINRQVVQRITGLDGGQFAAQHRNPRTWQFRAALISSDDAGAEYGLRWLTAVLQSSACDTCTTCDLRVRLVCPPANCSNDSLGEWASYSVALTDGPHEVDQFSPGAYTDVLGGCRDFITVEWTMVAGNPWLYKQPVPGMTVTLNETAACTDICQFLFGEPTEIHCLPISPPARGAISGIFTLTSPGGYTGGLFLEGYATCPGSSSSSPDPELQMKITEVPAGSTVVVDCAQRKITVTDADGNVSDGQYLIALPDGRSLEWIDVPYCDTIMCLCVRAAASCAYGNVTIAVATQYREG